MAVEFPREVLTRTGPKPTTSAEGADSNSSRWSPKVVAAATALQVRGVATRVRGVATQVHSTLRVIFDALWQAAGSKGSPNYAEDGSYTRKRVR